MQRELTHRLALPHAAVADLDIAVQEDVGVGAAHELEHLYPEHGLGTLAIRQHAQGLWVRQDRAATEGEKNKSDKWA